MNPKLTKKFPNRSRIVANTESITNLRTINLKINMLVNLCCAPPPTTKQYKISSGAKNIYPAKLKMIFFYSIKIKRPVRSQKTDVWCFARLST